MFGLKKKQIQFVAYNIIVMLAILLVLEFSVRLLHPEIQSQYTDAQLFADSMYYGSWGLAPESEGFSSGALVEVNEYGTRQYSEQIDTSKAGWLLLGDSVTLGIGVEADSTFAGIVQSKMDSINILNPSQIGYRVKDYFNVLRSYTSGQHTKLNVKRVTLFWCLNDLYIDVDAIEEPGGVFRYIFSDLLSFIRTHSHSYLFLKNTLFDRPQTYYQFDRQFYTKENPNFSTSVEYLTRISKICENYQLPFDVVLLPYEYQIRTHATDRSAPQRLLEESLLEQNIDVYDTLRQVPDGGFPDKLFLYGDGIHLSKDGHKFIAEFILANLL